MAAPVRLQLSRRKGFDLQEHSRAVNGLPAVSVARGARRMWGNPFSIGSRRCTGSGDDYREKRVEDAATAVKFFREMLAMSVRNYPSDMDIRKHLRGKNLACFCSLDSACHADVLLELANRPICEV